jgi:regulator of replication initiation timing
MSTLHAHIEQLEQQILRLIARSQEQKTKLQKLQKENDELKKKLLHQQQYRKIAAIPQSASSQWIQEQPSTQQHSLRHYLTTIDDCIAFLEKL